MHPHLVSELGELWNALAQCALHLLHPFYQSTITDNRNTLNTTVLWPNSLVFIVQVKLLQQAPRVKVKQRRLYRLMYSTVCELMFSPVRRATAGIPRLRKAVLDQEMFDSSSESVACCRPGWNSGHMWRRRNDSELPNTRSSSLLVSCYDLYVNYKLPLSV